MAGASGTVQFDDGPIVQALTRLALAAREPAGLLAVLGMTITEQTRRRFQAQEAPDGSPWKGLSPAYAEIRPRPGSAILVQTGALYNSIHFTVAGRAVVVGSAMKYAGVHQFGATIRPVSARALAFRLGDGGGGSRLVMVKKVVIPARPFLGFAAADEEEMIAEAQAHLAREMKG